MSFFSPMRYVCLLVVLIMPQTSHAGHDSDKSYVQHSFLWQAGWTTAFSSSLILNGLVATSQKSSREQKFDARLSLLTSSSGLLSVLINPLPVAYASEREWTADPELIRLTQVEVERRRGLG